MGRFNERGTKYRPCAWELNDGICTRENCQSAHGDELKETISGYLAGWHSWRKAVQTPSHSPKASGGEARAADSTMWSSSDLRDGVLESKVELKAAVESMKSNLMKEVAGILQAQAEEHSKALAQIQVTKTETRSVGSRCAAGVYSGQGSNASVTALTAEPLEEGQEGSVENCKFEWGRDSRPPMCGRCSRNSKKTARLSVDRRARRPQSQALRPSRSCVPVWHSCRRHTRQCQCGNECGSMLHQKRFD